MGYAEREKRKNELVGMNICVLCVSYAGGIFVAVCFPPNLTTVGGIIFGGINCCTPFTQCFICKRARAMMKESSELRWLLSISPQLGQFTSSSGRDRRTGRRKALVASPAWSPSSNDI